MKSALFPIQTAGSYWAAGVRVRPLGRASGWDPFYRTQRECSYLGPLYCVAVERAINIQLLYGLKSSFECHFTAGVPAGQATQYHIAFGLYN